MKFKVLISAPYFHPVVEKYRSVFEQHNIEMVVPEVNERLSEQELLNCIGDIDGVICGDDQFTPKVFEQAKKLKVISKWGTGIDSIDQQSAEQQGIPIKNTLNAFADAVADTALGFMLSFARQIPWADQDIRAGQWKKIPGFALNECTLGIIGMGNIGRAVARRAKAFGMRLLGNDIVEIPKEVIAEYGLTMCSLEQCLREADLITLHCDLNPSSYHLIDEEQFKIMKSSAYIINTARGPVINEQALVEALRTNKIAGAGLDVFEQEPLPLDSPLRKFSKVLFSPHNSNSSPSAWTRVHENTVKNLIDELNKHIEL